jgi:NADH-quinone oxidoreductase subunit G
MPNITINGVKYFVEDNITIMQACDIFGVAVPRFCYHELLPAVGNCRMCLVEVKGQRKPIPSCVTNITEGMEIITQNEAVEDARKTVIEMLLVNHPLDCPICDKGGECDLQDQTYRFGLDRSQINVPKRAVAPKNFGPLIDSYMTRCIHCTRCIRFATEIAGVEEIGGFGRGDHTEITAYVNNTLTSNLSGNIADVCPVGALTNSSYAFKARPWELISTETIDIMDAVGSNIKVDSSLLAVLRILPRANGDINEEWLADKGRYIVDATRVQRLDKTMVKVDNKLQYTNWQNALDQLSKQLKIHKPEEIAIITGDFVDLETIFSLKELATNLGIQNIDCRINDIAFEASDPSSYLFNTKIANIEEADACLIIGSNPYNEAPLVNTRLRKRYLKGNFDIALIGKQVNLTYKYDYLGEDIAILNEILDGKHAFCKVLENAKKPMLILGLGALNSKKSKETLKLVKLITQKYNLVKDDWNGFNVLQTSTSLINGLAIGFTQKDANKTVSSIMHDVFIGKIKFLWLVGVDNIDFTKINKDTFVVYQGHHGDLGAKNASVILPSTLWLEKDSTYINLEGRIQQTKKAVATVGEAKEDWKIIRKISEILNINMNFNNLAELRRELVKKHPHLSNNFISYIYQAEENNAVKIDTNKITYIIDNYYVTDVISKNSVKLNLASKLINEKIGRN